MLSSLNDDERYLIYKALVRMIETNSGTGFHNADQGHPAYVLGAQGKVGMGDSPEENRLFKIVSELSASFAPEFSEVGPDLSTWQKFCAFAVESYKRPSGQS